MVHGSQKHGPRADDRREQEVQGTVRGGHSTRAQEWRDPEPSGEDQPDVDRAPDTTLVGGAPDDMTASDVERRSEIATYLGKEGWPATGRQLYQRASAGAAPEHVLAALGSLERDAVFDTVQNVWQALGGEVEQRRF